MAFSRGFDKISTSRDPVVGEPGFFQEHAAGSARCAQQVSPAGGQDGWRLLDRSPGLRSTAAQRRHNHQKQ
jgi:hypothetical protein